MAELTTYSPKEAAKIFGVSVKTISRLVQQRKIAYTKIGRQIRFTPVHLTEYLRRNEQHVIGQGA